MRDEAMNGFVSPAAAPGPADRLAELSARLLGGGHRVRFRAPGRSMHPTIRDGEAITVAPVAAEAVRRGDIVLYRLDRSVIAHRVAGIERDAAKGLRFMLRGDACGGRDAPVAAGQVLGRVVAVERGGRTQGLYTKRAQMRYSAHALASRLKGLIRSRFPRLAGRLQAGNLAGGSLEWRRFEQKLQQEVEK